MGNKNGISKQYKLIKTLSHAKDETVKIIGINYLSFISKFQIDEEKRPCLCKNNKNNPKYKYKYNKIYKIIFHKNNISKYILILLLMLSFLLYLSKEIQFRKIISSSEITITITGTGEQNIINCQFLIKSFFLLLFLHIVLGIFWNIPQHCKLPYYQVFHLEKMIKIFLLIIYLMKYKLMGIFKVIKEKQ